MTATNGTRKLLLSLGGAIGIAFLGAGVGTFLGYSGTQEAVKRNSERILVLDKFMLDHGADISRHLDPVRNHNDRDQLMERFKFLEAQLQEANNRLIRLSEGRR